MAIASSYLGFDGVCDWVLFGFWWCSYLLWFSLVVELWFSLILLALGIQSRFDVIWCNQDQILIESLMDGSDMGSPLVLKGFSGGFGISVMPWLTEISGMIRKFSLSDSVNSEIWRYSCSVLSEFGKISQSYREVEGDGFEVLIHIGLFRDLDLMMDFTSLWWRFGPLYKVSMVFSWSSLVFAHLITRLICIFLLRGIVSQAGLLNGSSNGSAKVNGPAKLQIKVPKFDNSELIKSYSKNLIERCMNTAVQSVSNLLLMLPWILKVDGRLASADLGLGKFQLDFDNEEDIVRC